MLLLPHFHLCFCEEKVFLSCGGRVLSNLNFNTFLYLDSARPFQVDRFSASQINTELNCLFKKERFLLPLAERCKWFNLWIKVFLVSLVYQWLNRTAAVCCLLQSVNSWIDWLGYCWRLVAGVDLFGCVKGKHHLIGRLKTRLLFRIFGGSKVVFSLVFLWSRVDLQ